MNAPAFGSVRYTSYKPSIDVHMKIAAHKWTNLQNLRLSINLKIIEYHPLSTLVRPSESYQCTFECDRRLIGYYLQYDNRTS